MRAACVFIRAGSPGDAPVSPVEEAPRGGTRLLRRTRQTPASMRPRGPGRLLCRRRQACGIKPARLGRARDRGPIDVLRVQARKRAWLGRAYDRGPRRGVLFVLKPAPWRTAARAGRRPRDGLRGSGRLPRASARAGFLPPRFGVGYLCRLPRTGTRAKRYRSFPIK